MRENNKEKHVSLFIILNRGEFLFGHFLTLTELRLGDSGVLAAGGMGDLASREKLSSANTEKKETENAAFQKTKEKKELLFTVKDTTGRHPGQAAKVHFQSFFRRMRLHISYKRERRNEQNERRQTKRRYS